MILKYRMGGWKQSRPVHGGARFETAGSINCDVMTERLQVRFGRPAAVIPYKLRHTDGGECWELLTKVDKPSVNP